MNPVCSCTLRNLLDCGVVELFLPLIFLFGFFGAPIVALLAITWSIFAHKRGDKP